ncbi:hypothetical protein FBZ93_1335 [Bradyrhizobium macuxiense]|uniref:Uncharacterized protein n=1 Tax=Bradyrhizobium macuxiense TaxID=1755647 RepID=A0A560KRZ5_9BRAD|nr:hypothetical protein FBZ93_1335 [Bradyrhizobium macuxiense]
MHATALPGNPYEGHTLGDVINSTETLTLMGCAIEGAYVNKGCRGHTTENPRSVFISGQKRGVSLSLFLSLERLPFVQRPTNRLKNNSGSDAPLLE